MQATEEGQTRRGLSFKQHQDDGEIRGFYPLVERLVVFKHLPIANTPLAHQQDEGVRLRDLIGERFRPEAPRAQTRRREEHANVRILSLKRGLQPLGQRLIRRMVAQEPSSHSKPSKQSPLREESRQLSRIARISNWR